MLVAENQHLEAMVHKYRTEYDVVRKKVSVIHSISMHENHLNIQK